MSLDKLETIRRIRKLRAEQDYCLQLLEFYAWLEQFGITWQDVQGYRPLDNTPRSRNEFKASCRRHGLLEQYHAWQHAYFIEQQSATGQFYWKKVDEDYDGSEKVVCRLHTYRGKLIDIMLKDGRQLILPWPPFPESVIYNRRESGDF